MKVPVDVAAKVGKYGAAAVSQVEVKEQLVEVDDIDQAHYQHEDDGKDVQVTEVSPEQSSPVNESPKVLPYWNC